MSPVTLTTVAKMSGIESAAISRPIPSSGIPALIITGAVTTNRPPLGIPGLLKLIAIVTSVMTTICEGSRWMP